MAILLIITKAMAELPSDAAFAVLFGAMVRSKCGLHAPLHQLAAVNALLASTSAALGLAIGAAAPRAEHALAVGGESAQSQSPHSHKVRTRHKVRTVTVRAGSGWGKGVVRMGSSNGFGLYLSPSLHSQTALPHRPPSSPPHQLPSWSSACCLIPTPPAPIMVIHMLPHPHPTSSHHGHPHVGWSHRSCWSLVGEG